MDLNLIVEVLSVALNVAFIILLMRENIWCWPIGIIGSILSVYLFISVDLNAEAILYTFYVLMGIYGWLSWKRNSVSSLPITKWRFQNHIILSVFSLSIGLLVGWIFDNYTNSAYPYIDSQTTVLGIGATFLEARKKLNSWIYWIVLNAVTIFLYASRDLYLYSGLMVLYFALSIQGYIIWRKRFNAA